MALALSFSNGRISLSQTGADRTVLADIACHHAQLIIEIDGDTHGTTAAVKYDAARDAYLRSRGFQVLRFSNEDVMTNPDGVLAAISEVLTSIPSRLRPTSTTSN